ncbi:hypothetical protein HK096_006910 [Nowakowskiella sp. JEL0078]|nr:hypothetical protein HK096_006910 [Nowakowskiella sp. JEL0078]
MNPHGEVTGNFSMFGILQQIVSLNSIGSSQVTQQLQLQEQLLAVQELSPGFAVALVKEAVSPRADANSLLVNRLALLLLRKHVVKHWKLTQKFREKDVVISPSEKMFIRDSLLLVSDPMLLSLKSIFLQTGIQTIVFFWLPIEHACLSRNILIENFVSQINSPSSLPIHKKYSLYTLHKIVKCFSFIKTPSKIATLQSISQAIFPILSSVLYQLLDLSLNSLSQPQNTEELNYTLECSKITWRCLSNLASSQGEFEENPQIRTLFDDGIVYLQKLLFASELLLKYLDLKLTYS